MTDLSVARFLGQPRVAQATPNLEVVLTTYAAGPDAEDWHTHSCPSLSLVLGGGYREDLAGRPYTRAVGDLKWVAADTVHRCRAYAPDTLQLNLLLRPSFWAITGRAEEQQLPSQVDESAIRLALLRLGHELVRPDTSLAAVELLAYALFADRAWQPRPTPPAWVSHLRELLHEPGESVTTLAGLAQVLGVHPVTISRAFPHYFAVTLSQYQRRLKVERALGLLRTTTRSLTDIAYACGFADQSHFTHAFRAATGFLPKELRRL